MSRERALLNAEKANHKERLEFLRHYIRELTDRCTECGTEHEDVTHALVKAEHDAQYYEHSLKEINSRLKTLTPKAKKSADTSA